MKYLCRLALVIPLLTLIAPGHAQDFPSKPIRFIVPFGAGSATDTLARVIGAKLSDAWGQPVIIENRPGSGSVVGTGVAAKAAPDGHTLLMVSSSHATNATLFTNLPFDPVKDFAGVTPVALIPNVLIVHPDVPARNVTELVALAKSKPGALNYGTAGAGSGSHLNAELFKSTAGIDIVHVPFKGFNEYMTELVAGRLHMAFAPVVLAYPHIQGGKVRALAIGTGKRSAALPDLPTLAESGLTECVLDPWFGVLVPAGTPRPVIDKLNAGIDRALQSPDVVKQLSSQGAEPMYSRPDEFDQYIRSEVVKLGKIVRASGARSN
ncbi:MAG: Bug family tripartite tricarboxylate transporter substrate binding protein [Burkholderiales bacterium]